MIRNPLLPLARTVGLLTTVVISLPHVGEAAESNNRKPNVIVIVADDLGYSDVGFNAPEDGDTPLLGKIFSGATGIPTPNLDQVAKGGVRFTDGYVTCPVCSPTRAGLVTGRYQQRFGHEHNPGPPNDKNDLQPFFGLPLSEKTIADRLKAAGYATGIVGKWHLGMGAQHVPTARGFDEFFGFLHGAHSYLDSNEGLPIFRGTERVNEPEYLTDAFAREAVSFIDRNADKPFFLYLTFNAVHSPMEATDKYLERFKIGDPTRKTYAAMLSALDDAVGRVTKQLDDKGLTNDTIVFFVSDNGGPIYHNGSENFPLRGAKAQLFEGGIRVPFLLRWPNRVPAGKVYGSPVVSLDILPTVLSAVGLPLPTDVRLDGVDLVPYVKGEAPGVPHETLYWRFGLGYAAVRLGDWKLIQIADRRPQLYNLGEDITERNNLAAANPSIVEDLSNRLAKWEGEIEKPRWETVNRHLLGAERKQK